MARCARRIDHRDAGAADAGGQTRLRYLALRSHVGVVAGSGLLAHHRVFGRGVVQLQPLAGSHVQVLAHQLLVIRRSLPGAAELVHQPGVFTLLLPVQILQLLPDLDNSGKIRPMFRAQLRLLKLQLTLTRVNLDQQRRCKSAALTLQVRIGGDHQLRITPVGGAIFSFAQDAITGGRRQLPAQLVNLKQRGAVLRFRLLPVRLSAGGAENAMLRSGSQSGADSAGPFVFQIFELVIEPV